jgi:hypothetical protein
MIRLRSAAFNRWLRDFRSAATPVACGAAIDVPPRYTCRFWGPYDVAEVIRRSSM